jgi:hypothetical protein
MNIIANWDQIWTALFNAVVPVFFAGLLALLRQGFTYSKGKIALIQDQYVRSGLLAAEQEAENLTTTIVASLQQTLVNGLKDQNGGTLSPSDAKKVKDEAVTKIKILLSDEAHAILEAHRTDIVEYLGHLIEAEVFRNKADYAVLKSHIA